MDYKQLHKDLAKCIYAAEEAREMHQRLLSEINMWRELYLSMNSPAAESLEEKEVMAGKWIQFMSTYTEDMVREGPEKILEKVFHD